MTGTLEAFYRELDALYTKGDLQEVASFLSSQKDAFSENYPAQLGEMIAVSNEIGSFYRGTSRYDKSLEAFQAAREQIASELGKNCVQYATVLNNMAGTYRVMGDYQKAIDLFTEAREIYQNAGAGNSYAYASVLNNLSQAYLQEGRYPEAIQFLEEALRMICEMPDTQQDIAITYNNLAALYRASGNHEKAKESAEKAIESFEKCADEENVHYAAGLNSLAGLLYAEQQYEKALELYQKSSDYTHRFFGENIEYGITCRNMYYVYERMGRIDEAICALEKAKDNFARILGEEHERTLAVVDDLRRLQASAV